MAKLQRRAGDVGSSPAYISVIYNLSKSFSSDHRERRRLAEDIKFFKNYSNVNGYIKTITIIVIRFGGNMAKADHQL